MNQHYCFLCGLLQAFSVWEEMALLPGVGAWPGLLAGGVLLLALGSNPVRVVGQNTDHNGTSTNPPPTPGPNITLIVVPIVVVGLLVIASAVLTWLFCVVRKKRQTEGTYRPSAEEQTGARSVETPDALKLPKEERLI
uniref:Crumbs homolog 3b n=2 Tax=Esox lucius TaxID=8010 RepID=A0AAY5JYW4_ESOLU